MPEIEWALEYYDPDYITMDQPAGRIRYQHTRDQRSAEHLAMHKIPQGKEDYRAVSRVVQPWRPANMEPHQVTYIGNNGRRQIKGTGAIPNGEG